MIRILLLFMVCWTTQIFAQVNTASYSYSFRGTTDFDLLDKRVANLEVISRYKIRVKDKEGDPGGEILFEVTWEEGKGDENPAPDFIVDLKKIVVEAGLEPVDFTIIQTRTTPK